MDLSPLLAKLRRNLADVEAQMASPGVTADQRRYAELAREHRRLTTVVTADDELQKKRRQLADNQELLAQETDAEFREVIVKDIAELEEACQQLDRRVLGWILPPGQHDSRNIIVEIRPAAGGEEAALFAGDLFRMYCRYAERRNWRTEVLDLTETALGGLKEVSFSVVGEEVYRGLQRESGVHRVQRIPVTEAGGRIHTSTVTVAVLPEPEKVEIAISPDELRIDVYHSSGPGGQSVNTSDSAVRITHLPTGLSVPCQQERSQQRNRDLAMRILRARLLEIRQREEEAKYAATRRSQVGTGDRSERIRTYNFPQNRVTDHRYGLSWHNLSAILQGDLDRMLEEILALENARRLEAELANS